MHNKQSISTLRHPQPPLTDVGMAKEDSKVHLVLEVNQDTLSHMNAYITLRGGDEMTHLETIPDTLCHILYIQILAHLK